MTLPHFDLAPLDDFDPEALMGGRNSADAFVILLATAFNDMKDHLWLSWLISEHPPADTEHPNPYLGQYNGLRVHVLRNMFATAHELLEAIKSAASAPLWQDSTFNEAVQSLTGEFADGWSDLVQAAAGSPGTSAMRAFLDKVRNRAAFHYDRTLLWDGYNTFFKSSHVSLNDNAYVSLGDSGEATRFYFADAAVQVGYVSFDKTGTDVIEANKQILAMNVALRGLIQAYLILLQATLP